ncbi:hypothetical protein ACFLQ3_01980 [Bacteroidota bacterium]
MKRLFILSSLLLICSVFLMAQETTSNLIDEDKDKFEEDVFNKEFGDDLDTADLTRKLLDKIPDKLPDWVLGFYNNQNRIIAFSDPNMDKKDAYQQAILRAKAIFALMNYSTISNITDDYTNLKESGKYSLYTTKFQDFSLAKAEIAYNDSSVVLVDTFFTKYNEGVVIIDFNYQVDSNKNKDTLVIRGEHLQVFSERNFKKEKVEFYNLSIQDNLEKDSVDFLAQYNYKIINRGYDINSIYGHNIIEFEERSYNYRTDIEFTPDSANLEENYYRLNRGLWNGYLTGVLKNITTLSKQLASKVKNSNDFYTLKNEGLIRTVARNKVSFGYNDFKLHQNQFYIDLNGIILQ